MRAINIEKDEAGYRASVQDLEDGDLPPGEVTVAIDYSTLNYKDSLAITGAKPVIRQFPMTPGVDFAGRVLDSTHPEFQPGDRVVLNGWGVGELQRGGLAQKARVKGEWLIPLPAAFTTKQVMTIGTAGYTAMLCVMALEAQGITPDRGPVVVTGATGGVGSVAVTLLAKLGYDVTALTGKPEEAEYLKRLGATTILDRHSLPEKSRPLEKERWAGVIDAVGGQTLATLCAQTRYGGVVAACGLAESMDFPATVLPFILRGVTLVGVDSVYCPREKRMAAWQRLARDLDLRHLDSMQHEITLAEALKAAPQQLAGKLRGRIVVDVNR